MNADMPLKDVKICGNLCGNFRTDQEQKLRFLSRNQFNTQVYSILLNSLIFAIFSKEKLLKIS